MPFYAMVLAPFCLLVLASPVSQACASDDDALQRDLQFLLNNISAVTGYAISLGFKDATRSFGLGSGQRDPEGFASQLGGNASGTDHFLFGSGTKPFTAVAVLRLVEHGAIGSLDEPAWLYVDRVLQRTYGTSMVALLGQSAAQVAAEHTHTLHAGGLPSARLNRDRLYRYNIYISCTPYSC